MQIAQKTSAGHGLRTTGITISLFPNQGLRNHRVPQNIVRDFSRNRVRLKKNIYIYQLVAAQIKGSNTD
jgi:hypothetical protein